MKDKIIDTINLIIPKIIEKSGIRDANEIFEYLVSSSYQLLPFPIRMIIKEETYTSTVIENKTRVLEIITRTLNKPKF